MKKKNNKWISNIHKRHFNNMGDYDYYIIRHYRSNGNKRKRKETIFWSLLLSWNRFNRFFFLIGQKFVRIYFFLLEIELIKSNFVVVPGILRLPRFFVINNEKDSYFVDTFCNGINTRLDKAYNMFFYSSCT